MLIDHIGLAISDYVRSKAFYQDCLRPLNIELVVEIEQGLAATIKPSFGLALIA